MDKRIIFVIGGVLVFVTLFLVLRFFFFNKEKIEVNYVIKNISNNRAMQDSVIEFADNTKDAIDWKWNFGDGEYSSDPAPKHSYSQAGNYKIILSVTTSSGSAIDSTKLIKVISSIPVQAAIPEIVKKDTSLPPPISTRNPQSPSPPKTKKPLAPHPKHQKSNHTFSTGDEKIHELDPNKFDK